MRPLLRHLERVPCRRLPALSDDDRLIETRFRYLKQTMGLPTLRDKAMESMVRGRVDDVHHRPPGC